MAGSAAVAPAFSYATCASYQSPYAPQENPVPGSGAWLAVELTSSGAMTSVSPVIVTFDGALEMTYELLGPSVVVLPGRVIVPGEAEASPLPNVAASPSTALTFCVVSCARITNSIVVGNV